MQLKEVRERDKELEAGILTGMNKPVFDAMRPFSADEKKTLESIKAAPSDKTLSDKFGIEIKVMFAA